MKLLRPSLHAAMIRKPQAAYIEPLRSDELLIRLQQTASPDPLAQLQNGSATIWFRDWNGFRTLTTQIDRGVEI